MKKNKFLAIVLALVITVLLPLQVSASSAFKDVSSSHWASDNIDQLFKRGIVLGTGNNEFMPTKEVTRAQAAVMITRALKLDISNVVNPNYSDLRNDHYAYKEIAAVTKANIMSGYNGKFDPDKPLTRAAMAVVIANAFELAGEQTVNFSDVNKDFWGYEAIDAIYAAGITTGHDDGTFQPNKNITRAEYATMLNRALTSSESALAELLKDVYNNEANIESFAFTSDFQLSINLPATLSDEIPELAVLAEALKDVKVNVDGKYQLDPMKIEMDLQVVLGGALNMTIDLPMLLTEDKMLMKLPNIPLFPLPEELVGKFIEIDLAELEEMQGIASTPNLNQYAVQAELTKALYDLVFDLFADGFYEYSNEDAITIPDGVNVKEVVKFEMKNEDLKRFLLITIEDFLPMFIELMADPDFAEAFGMTEEDIEMMNSMKEELQIIQEEIIATLDEIVNIVSINEFESYIVINEDHHIPYSTTVIDIELTVDGEVLGFKLYSVDEKNKINEKQSFKYDQLKDSDIINFEQLLQLELENGL